MQRLGILRKYTLELYGRPSATHELGIRMLRAEDLETILYAFFTLRACARATTTRCADPIMAFWLAASVGKRTIVPTTRFSFWTRLWRRELRTSKWLRAGSGSCSRDLWRAWRARDCRSALCSENCWWARAAWGGEGGWGVSWTASELLVSTPTSGRLQPRTRRNGARWWNKGRDVLWRKGSLQRMAGLDYGMQ